MGKLKSAEDICNDLCERAVRTQETLHKAFEIGITSIQSFLCADVKGLQESLAEFSTVLSSVAKVLGEARVQIQDSGQIDGASALLEDTERLERMAASIDRARADFASSSGALRKATDELRALLSEGLGLEKSLAILKTATQLEDLILRKDESVRFLSRAKTLHHKSPDHDETLNAIRKEAARLLIVLENEGPIEEEGRLFMERKHPLAHLLLLIACREEIGDKEWDVYVQSVEERFGKDLLRDVHRERLVFADTNEKSSDGPISDANETPLPTVEVASDESKGFGVSDEPCESGTVPDESNKIGSFEKPCESEPSSEEARTVVSPEKSCETGHVIDEARPIEIHEHTCESEPAIGESKAIGTSTGPCESESPNSEPIEIRELTCESEPAIGESKAIGTSTEPCESESPNSEMPVALSPTDDKEPESAQRTSTRNESPKLQGTLLSEKNRSEFEKFVPSEATAVVESRQRFKTIKKAELPMRFSPKQAYPGGSRALAREIQGNLASRTNDLEWLVVELFCGGQVQLAMHVAEAIERMNLQSLQAWMLGSLLASPYLVKDIGSGELAAKLGDAFENFDPEILFRSGDSDWNESMSFLMVAVAVRPALLAPQTNASVLLESLRLRDGLQCLYNFSQAVLKYCKSVFLPLNLSALANIHTQESWNKKMEDVFKEIETWFEHAKKRNLIHWFASQIWRHYFQKRFARLFEDILREKEKYSPGSIRQQIGQYSTAQQLEEDVEQFIRYDMKRSIGNDSTRKGIRSIVETSLDGIHLLQQLIDLHQRRPGQTGDFLQQQAEELRKTIFLLHAGVQRELDTFGDCDNPMLRAASITCRRAIDQVIEIFSPSYHLPKEPSLRSLWQSDLLRMENVDLDERNWKPSECPQEKYLKELLYLCVQGKEEWLGIYERHFKRRDHKRTGMIIEHFKSGLVESVDVPRMETIRIEDLRLCRQNLAQRIGEVRVQLEQAAILNVIDRKEQAEASARLDSIAVDNVLDFHSLEGWLGQMMESLQRKQEELSQRLRSDLRTKQLQVRRPDLYERIDRALKEGHILAAHLYSELAESEQQLPELDFLGVPFLPFFPNFVLKLNEFAEKKNGKPYLEIFKNFGRYSEVGPLDLRGLRGALIDEAREMLENWSDAKRAEASRLKDSHLSTVFTGIGFGVKKIEILESLSDQCLVKLETQIVSDANLCMISDFGSKANGCYNLLCFWGRPTEERIVNQVQQIRQRNTSPVIVVYFGRMTEKSRRQMAGFSRQRQVSFLLLDEVLLVYLAAQSGDRRKVFFDCTLPFTMARPYVPTGQVQAEMFVGREMEIRSLIDPAGSCLVYGGRQIGKTAILKEIERRYHQNGRQIFQYYDLKKELGNHQAELIWGILLNCLAENGVMSRQGNPGPQAIQKKVRDWLDEESDRRILLLFDEADYFMNIEMSPRTEGNYPNLIKLKGLMNDTCGRFKVVFAGLHDVQRIADDPNTPLAQLGKPLCIGPLLDKETLQAIELITRPFNSLGYAFESEGLILSILYHTNHYPSLIQIFCGELLEHLQSESYPLQECPPYWVKKRHIDEAYSRKGLEKMIRDRFELTLNLDLRYRLLALCISWMSLENRERTLKGFSPSEIRKQATDWWPQGFTLPSINEFETLLDEMIGLGVLRLSGGKGYTLRNANILKLLGDSERVEELLIEMEQLKLPVSKNPMLMHQIVEHYRINPFNFGQEALLNARGNGVSIFCGSHLCGISNAAKFLENSAVFAGCKVCRAGNFKKFKDIAREAMDSRREGTNLLVVPHDVPWDSEWLEEASETCHRMRSSNSFFRFIFLADESIFWRICCDPAEFHAIDERGISMFFLEPLNDHALYYWVEEAGFNALNHWQDFVEASGHWPSVLELAYELCHDAPQNWKQSLSVLPERVDWKKTLPLSDEILFALGHMMSYGEPMLEEELVDWLAAASGKEYSAVLSFVRNLLFWGERLHFIKPGGQMRWVLESIVKTGLEKRNAE